MGLFDIFQRGGKYFDKDIPPHCEYCDFGKRAKDGNKVLCDKRGLVDADFSCAKFVYSPLKRIPVKQLNRVGFLDEDDEFNDDEFNDDDEQEEPKKQPDTRQAPPPLQAADAAPAPAPETKPVATPAAPTPPAPTPEEKSVQNGAPVPEEAPASDTPKQEAASADAAANAAALEAEKAMEAAFQAMNQPKKS